MFELFKKNNHRKSIQDPKVDALKEKIGAHAAKAAKSANKLNRLLEANGITLRIYIATGGKNHGHL